MCLTTSFCGNNTYLIVGLLVTVVFLTISQLYNFEKRIVLPDTCTAKLEERPTVLARNGVTSKIYSHPQMSPKKRQAEDDFYPQMKKSPRLSGKTRARSGDKAKKKRFSNWENNVYNSKTAVVEWMEWKIILLCQVCLFVFIHKYIIHVQTLYQFLSGPSSQWCTRVLSIIERLS